VRDDLTVVYYSSNREDERFESHIRRNLLAVTGDLPMVSVTQKPSPELGTNICVGDVGVSQNNCKRQILIGAEAAKTKWVAFAEADFLYPHEYFDLAVDEPAVDTVYFYQPVYFLARKQPVFRMKMYMPEGASVCSRELVIRETQRALKGKPEWIGELEDRKDKPNPLSDVPRVTFNGGPAAIIFKTPIAMHRGIRCHGSEHDVTCLPYWGTASGLWLQFFGGYNGYAKP